MMYTSEVSWQWQCDRFEWMPGFSKMAWTGKLVSSRKLDRIDACIREGHRCSNGGSEEKNGPDGKFEVDGHVETGSNHGCHRSQLDKYFAWDIRCLELILCSFSSELIVLQYTLGLGVFASSIMQCCQILQ